jgi:outer membrane receptor protein involved in Fe transport
VNYSRYNANSRPIENTNSTPWTPQNASAGVSYRYHKFNASLSGSYNDEGIISLNSATAAFHPNEPQYLKQRLVCDLGAGWQLNRNASLFLSGRNVFNEGHSWYFKSDHRMQMKQKYGGQWTVGVKGSF